MMGESKKDNGRMIEEKGGINLEEGKGKKRLKGGRFSADQEKEGSQCDPFTNRKREEFSKEPSPKVPEDITL